MDGTVSLASGPGAPPPLRPPPRAVVQLDPAAAPCRGSAPGTCGSSGCRTPPPGHCPLPAAPPGRARTPGTGAAPAPVLPAGHVRPGDWQGPGSRPRAAGMPTGGAPAPRRSAAAAQLPRGAGGWNTLTAGAPLSPFFPSDSALRRCSRPPGPRRLSRRVPPHPWASCGGFAASQEPSQLGEAGREGKPDAH